VIDFFMKRCLLRALWLLMAELATGNVWAGPLPPVVPGRQVVRSYGLEQGLGNLSVHCLAQDSLGFLWVGTEDGLYRFSGREFLGYGQSDGLPSSTIDQVVATPTGKLWVGTPKGLALWNGLGFSPVAQDRGLEPGAIRALGLGPGGKLLVGTDGGLFELISGDRFRRVLDWPGGGVTAIWDEQICMKSGWRPGTARGRGSTGGPLKPGGSWI